MASILCCLQGRRYSIVLYPSLPGDKAKQNRNPETEHLSSHSLLASLSVWLFFCPSPPPSSSLPLSLSLSPSLPFPASFPLSPPLLSPTLLFITPMTTSNVYLLTWLMYTALNSIFILISSVSCHLAHALLLLTHGDTDLSETSLARKLSLFIHPFTLVGDSTKHSI